MTSKLTSEPNSIGSLVACPPPSPPSPPPPSSPPSRHVWNGEVQKARQVASIDYQTEVYQYVTPSMPPLTDRDHCVLR